LLIEHIEEKSEIADQKVILSPSLIVRKSCGANGTH